METALPMLFGLAVTALLIWAIVRSLKPQDRVCPSCHTSARIRGRPRGSAAIEIVLWLFLLLPGLIYTMWRGGKKVFPCPACGAETVPADTPAGRKITGTA